MGRRGGGEGKGSDLLSIFGKKWATGPTRIAALVLNAVDDPLLDAHRDKARRDVKQNSFSGKLTAVCRAQGTLQWAIVNEGLVLKHIMP